MVNFCSVVTFGRSQANTRTADVYTLNLKTLEWQKGDTEGEVTIAFVAKLPKKSFLISLPPLKLVLYGNVRQGLF